MSRKLLARFGKFEVQLFYDVLRGFCLSLDNSIGKDLNSRVDNL